MYINQKRSNFKICILIAFVFSFGSVLGQILTHEDSLSAGLTIRGNSATAISGYGEISYTRNLESQTAEAEVKRAILFFGHRFSNKITFFSEWELEGAKVTTGSSGEFSLEQCFLKFDVNRQIYINAGFFTPRIGQINENHLPNTFNGVDRPVVEKMIIPATWREAGICLYGRTRSLPGLNYSFGIVNGLNAANFSMENGIREGRYEGNEASARNIAATAAVLYYYGGWRLQASSYYGGSMGLADSMNSKLGLTSGTFGTPIMLNEANFQFRNKGLTLKGLASIIQIPDAAKINKVYQNNVPQKMIGAYLEVAYDLLYNKFKQEKQFITFARIERIDKNFVLSENTIADLNYTKNYIIAGFTYLPHRGVAIKCDYKYMITKVNHLKLLNIGLAYSF
jgi:hypothetical protein